MSAITRIVGGGGAPAAGKPPTHLRSVVDTFRSSARPHFYSVGSADKFLIGTVLGSYVCGLLSIKTWFAIAWPILLYFKAREIGRSRETKSVNTLAASLHNEADLAALREELAGLRRSQQLRLSRLLGQRGIVI